jgi:hypothetical protein
MTDSSSTGVASRLLLAAIALLVLSGCGNVTLVVPQGREVRLLGEEEPAAIRVERKLWFWQWGAAPISDNTTIPEIEAHDLKEIRVTTVQTFLDNVILTFTSLVSITCITLVVEGNP